MTKHLIITFILLRILSSCVMPEEYLQKTELHENDQVKLIYDGNRVYLIPKVSPNLELWSAKVEYRMTKVKGGFAPRMILNYDSTNNLFKSDIIPAIEIRRYGLFSSYEKKTIFLNADKELFEPQFLDFAKAKYKYLEDGSFITKYYDANNKPRCGSNGFKVYQTIDTTQVMWDDSLVDSYTFRIIYKIDCNGDTIK